MSYIDNTLMQGETVLYRTKPHWIIFGSAVFWLIAASALFIVGPDYQVTSYRIANMPIYAIVAYFALIVAAFSALAALITFYSSEYGVTNKRVLMKIGLIRRFTIEIFLHRIEGIRVYQSIMGRILGYGSLVIIGIGGSEDPFPNIPNPLAFRAKIQAELEKLPVHQTNSTEKE